MAGDSALIEEQWLRLVLSNIKQFEGRMSLDDLRAVFFCGAIAMFNIYTDACIDGHSDADAYNRVSRVRDEIIEFDRQNRG